MGEFTFRTNSKLKTLVGQELITNNNIAIFELIKNSYDAGATRVNIEFHDWKIELFLFWNILFARISTRCNS